MEDTVETLYNQEDILTYISFARQFKPQLTVVCILIKKWLSIKLCFINDIEYRKLLKN
jgi:hypothetical protein